ncbi:hypothetical protein [Paenibacillus harenae]
MALLFISLLLYQLQEHKSTKEEARQREIS